MVALRYLDFNEFTQVINQGQKVDSVKFTPCAPISPKGGCVCCHQTTDHIEVLLLANTHNTNRAEGLAQVR